MSGDGASSGGGLLGAAEVLDSARRAWRVETHRDARGRWLRVAPVHGDNEPFRASADGYRRDTWLAITAEEWDLLARLCAAPGADERLRHEAFRVTDRLVRAAQHAQLMGASEDEEDDG